MLRRNQGSDSRHSSAAENNCGFFVCRMSYQTGRIPESAFRISFIMGSLSSPGKPCLEDIRLSPSVLNSGLKHSVEAPLKKPWEKSPSKKIFFLSPKGPFPQV